MPQRVILRKQRREVAGKVYHPGEACMLPDELAEGLCLYGLCDIAEPARPGVKKPVVDEAATAKAKAAGAKTKAARGKPAPKKKAKSLE